MLRLFFLLNASAVLFGGALGTYIVSQIDVTKVAGYWVWILLGCFVLVVWGIVAYLLYGIRFMLNRGHSTMLLVRSERQAFLLGTLIALHLALQGFLLWNIFSGTILSLVVIIMEYYFLSQESDI